MHICTVTAHLQNSFVYLHIFTWTDVFFGLKCAKLSTFCVLQIFATTDVVALTLKKCNCIVQVLIYIVHMPSISYMTASLHD